jgi:HlyD family secretion protein
VRYYFLGQSKDNNFELSGMIEGYETDLGAKVEGRIESITVREGDRLKKGQIIAQLDNRELQAQLQGAKALIQTAKEEENQARLQIEVIQNQITEAQLNLRQSTEEAKGIINQAQSNLAASKAQLAEAQAQVKQVEAEKKLAQADHARSASLLQDGVISQQQFDQSQTQLDSTQATLQASRAAVNEAQKQVNVAEGEIIQAKTSSLNPEINKAVIGGLTKQLAQAQAQVKGAISKVADFKARQEEIAARLDDLKIISPIDGVVLTRNTEPGEVITRGTTLMTIIEPKRLFA